ncbi:MAG: glycosyltransferase, partial [Chloroflexi bacterium]|nr:glycosyltransferase [Chloroflexota bacterium]
LFIGTVKIPQKEVESDVSRLGLEDSVEFVGWLPYDEMLCYLSAAEIGLALYQPTEAYSLASRGNGRKFFTYMQAGLPIVGPAFSEIGQVVREEGCGVLVDTTDTTEIAAAIIDLLENTNKAEKMGMLGRKAVCERYNWEVEGQKLLKAYERAFES